MLRLQAAGKVIDVAQLVGELRDRGLYNPENGVSAARQIDLFRLFPLACDLPHYLERVVEMSHRRHALEQGV